MKGQKFAPVNNLEDDEDDNVDMRGGKKIELTTKLPIITSSPFFQSKPPHNTKNKSQEEDSKYYSIDFQDIEENNSHSIDIPTDEFEEEIDFRQARNRSLPSSSYKSIHPITKVFEIFNTYNELTYFKYPRLYGASVVIIFIVIPFLITIIVLNVYLAQSKNSGTISTSSNNIWKSFQATSTKGMVATDHDVCSQMGADILDLGGNAIEAAIAAAFCLGVISPASSGIGGGCYILIHKSDTKTQEFIDAREIAPKYANSTMFVGREMEAQDGPLAIATLGEVKGLYLAYQRHKSGNVPWKSLVLPAAKLAQEWTLSDLEASYIKKIKSQLLSGNFTLLADLFLKPGTKDLKTSGDIVKQPILAQTLTNIAEHPDYLYTTMASTLAAEIQSLGGILTKEDIINYEPVLREPIKANYSGYQYIGVGGSSSGGPIVVGLLKFMSSFSQPIASQGPLYYHRLAEAMKHMFAIRLALGDPDYVNVTDVYGALFSDQYMKNLADLTKDDNVLSLDQYGGKFNLEYSPTKDAGTTHLSVIDKDGNAVGLTSTINTYFGSKVISPSTGILWNNQMDDFSIPNASNYFGLAPSPYNYPEPYKKPLSSMSPSILLDTAGNVRLVGGGSGGPRIITATAQVILNYLGKGMDLLSSMISPRLHNQLLPNSIDIESTKTMSGSSIVMYDGIQPFLQANNQPNVSYVSGMGVTQFIAREYNYNTTTKAFEYQLIGVSDPRKDGKPAAMN